jgi:hypothetical protein
MAQVPRSKGHLWSPSYPLNAEISALPLVSSTLGVWKGRKDPLVFFLHHYTSFFFLIFLLKSVGKKKKLKMEIKNHR